MKNLSFLFVSALIAFTLAGCGHRKDVVKMRVASEKRMAMHGAAPMEVYLVKVGDAKDWSFFYNEIEGFNYVEGIEYVLTVQRVPVEAEIAAGASSVRYILVDVISMTETVSENMPPDIVGDTFVWTATVLNTYKPHNSTSDMGVKLRVTALNSPQDIFKEGDIVMAEMAGFPAVDMQIDGEYVFKAARIRGDDVEGFVLLGTTVQDLTN